MKAHFQNTLIFPMNFNDFMRLWGMIGVTSGHFRVTLVSLWGYFEATWRHLGSIGGPLGARWGIFGFVLGSWGLEVICKRYIGAYEGRCGSLQRYG